MFSSAVGFYFLYTVKVLIIHQYFRTPEEGGALRSYYLANALVKAGIEVSIITTHNSPEVYSTTCEGIAVHYLPVVYNNSFGFFRRVNSFLRFVLSIVREAGRFRDVDCCYAISTPLTTGLAAMWIQWRYNIPFVFEVGDLWPEAPVQMGVVRNPVLKFILYSLERWIYRSARGVVALSEAIQEPIRRLVPSKPMAVLPNMADITYFRPSGNLLEAKKKYGVEGRFVIAYIGTLGKANGLDYLLDCLKASKLAHQPVHLLLAGEGAEHDRLLQRIQSESLTNVTLLPFQTRDGVRDLLNAADAIFVSFLPLPVLETGSPNKYFDGLAAGKLVVINFGGWVKREIEAHRCGVALDGKDAAAFATMLAPFLADSSLLASYQQAARTLAETTYSRDTVGENLVRFLRSRELRIDDPSGKR